MQFTPAALAATRTGFNTAFKAVYDSMRTRTQYLRLATERSSKGEKETYAFLDRLPGMRRWVGERVWHGLKTHTYDITNADWEDGFEVERNHVEDDQLGLYSDAVRMLATAASFWEDDLATAALTSGTTKVCYDGQYFFDTDHPVDRYDPASATQSNYSASGMALTAPNYETVRATMMGYKGADGQPLGIVPDLLVVPPQLEATGKRIVVADRDASGATNTNAGSATLLTLPKLATDATAWYLLDTRWPVKPIIVQVRRRPNQIVALDQARDQNVVEHKKLRYGCDARGDFGYALWQMAYKAKA